MNQYQSKYFEGAKERRALYTGDDSRHYMTIKNIDNVKCLVLLTNNNITCWLAKVQESKRYQLRFKHWYAEVLWNTPRKNFTMITFSDNTKHTYDVYDIYYHKYPKYSEYLRIFELKYYALLGYTFCAMKPYNKSYHDSGFLNSSNLVFEMKAYQQIRTNMKKCLHELMLLPRFHLQNVQTPNYKTFTYKGKKWRPKINS